VSIYATPSDLTFVYENESPTVHEYVSFQSSNQTNYAYTVQMPNSGQTCALNGDDPLTPLQTSCFFSVPLPSGAIYTGNASLGSAQVSFSLGVIPTNPPFPGFTPSPASCSGTADGNSISGLAASYAGSGSATNGYWKFSTNGGVTACGSAVLHGSMSGQPLNRPITGIVSTPDGGGYWLVASDGGTFAFGDAQFYGSMGAIPLNKPVVSMAPTSDNGGYGSLRAAAEFSLSGTRSSMAPWAGSR
jgi:hypothetical protein